MFCANKRFEVLGWVWELKGEPWVLGHWLLKLTLRLSHKWETAGTSKANRREPKTCLGRVFNNKSGCFKDVHKTHVCGCTPTSIETRPSKIVKSWMLDRPLEIIKLCKWATIYWGWVWSFMPVHQSNSLFKRSVTQHNFLLYFLQSLRNSRFSNDRSKMRTCGKCHISFYGHI